MKMRSLSAVGALVFAGTFMVATPAHAASPSCTPKVVYDIGPYGELNMYPRATCDGATSTLAITSYHPSVGSQPIVYTNRPAGTYPGFGVTLPYDGPGTYCISVYVVWTWANGLLSDGAQSRNCVYRN